MKLNTHPVQQVLEKHGAELHRIWLEAQAGGRGRSRTTAAELAPVCREILDLLRQGLTEGGPDTLEGPHWGELRSRVEQFARTRTLQGQSPADVAMFFFSLRAPLHRMLARELPERDELIEAVERTDRLIDSLGMHTAEVHQRAREETILRQQQDMLELSTPVVKLWEGILGLPMIGTLDSSRAQVVMETLLQRIVETGSQTAILDITGVSTVDTLVAQHLIKTVNAARLMGAEVIISGIRPQIAQTIVHLGVDLGDVRTKATLADAFELALRNNGLRVTGSDGQEP